jgi:probable phosphoglycerate mutase
MLAMEATSVEQVRATMAAIEHAFLVGVEGVTEVWLVRHGDCYEGIDVVEDPPLSPRGIDEARRLGERLRRIGFAAVYSSHYRRALATARAISDEVTVDERLREIDIAWQPGDGGAGSAPLSKYVEFGEPPEAVIGRMRDAVQEAVDAHPGGRVVIVSHGAAILAYLTDVMRLEYGSLRLLPLYTSVSVVRVKEDRRMAHSIGDTSHLENALPGSSSGR